MPAFGNQMTGAQVAAIANDVTWQFGNPQSTVTAEQVTSQRARSRPQ